MQKLLLFLKAYGSFLKEEVELFTTLKYSLIIDKN